MSDESKVPSGEPVATGGQTQESNTSTTATTGGQADAKKVDYNTYMKTVDQEKALRQRLQEAEEKLRATEQAKLEAEGNKDELIQSLKTQVEEFKTKTAEEKAARAKEKISSQVQKRALEMGCVDPDLVTELVDFSRLSVDESYRVGEDSLILALDKLKRDKAYLFNQRKAAVIDGAPQATHTLQQSNDLSTMTYEQKQQLYRQKFGQ